MTQTGSLPLSGKITFNFSEEAFTLVTKKLSRQILVRATISFPDTPSVTPKIINVTVTDAHPPGSVSVHSRSIPKWDFFSDFFATDQKYAFGRVHDYLHNQILIKMGWLLMGFLDGAKKIPIMILYVPAIHAGAYSFKKDSETEEEFKAQLN